MMSEDEVRITLRLPVGLHRQLAEVADVSRRSLNAEIAERLVATFAPLQIYTEVGMRAVSARIEAATQLLEDVALAFAGKPLQNYLAVQAEHGNHLTRAEAVQKIVHEYLRQEGYENIDQPPPRPKRKKAPDLKGIRRGG